MKIDKIVFSSTEPYSDYWNLQAEVWSNMGIEPVLLLWGKKENTKATEKHGRIVEMEYSPDAIKSLQMTLSKFYYTQTEPEATWLTGDIDLYPLQRKWFTETVKDIPDDCYAHLSATALTSKKDNISWHTHGGFVGGGQDLVAYFHAAKGKVFNDVYKFDGISLTDYVNKIVATGKYGRHIPEECKTMTPKEIAAFTGSLSKDHTNQPYWCADENYTSDVLWEAAKNGLVKWKGLSYDLINWDNPYQSNRIDRYYWHRGNYQWVDLARLKNNGYTDIHCSTPFAPQENDLTDILRLAGMIKR
jgi:hypothetical protein